MNAIEKLQRHQQNIDAWDSASEDIKKSYMEYVSTFYHQYSVLNLQIEPNFIQDFIEWNTERCAHESI